VPFSDSVVKQAWARSGGRCECTKTTHGHGRICQKRLLEQYRGDDESGYGWEVQSISGVDTDKLDDCQIRCMDCLEEIHYL